MTFILEGIEAIEVQLVLLRIAVVVELIGIQLFPDKLLFLHEVLSLHCCVIVSESEALVAR